MTKFTISTKPLKNSIGIGIVDSNITQYYQKSMVAQLTVDANYLSIDVESVAIISEIRLAGSLEGDPATIIVDSAQFKKLVSTITAPQITMIFNEDFLEIMAGKSRFTLPTIMDASEVSINKPTNVGKLSSQAVTLEKSGWAFVKAHQMFAKATDTKYPVYTYVYSGKDGDVLVGNMQTSLFTHSNNTSTFDNTCLLSDSIINLLTSMPDGASIYSNGDSYVIHVKTDGYEFTSEFTPQYESDVWDYNASSIIPLMSVVGLPVSSASVSEIKTMLAQVSLVANRDSVIRCEVSSDHITFTADGALCEIDAAGGPSDPYTVILPISDLKTIIGNVSETNIGISPTYNSDDELAGITITSGNLTIVVASVNG